MNENEKEKKEGLQPEAAPKQETQPAEPPTEQPVQPTARERYRERYKTAYPDMDIDDEESFFGKANENLDELDEYRESNKALSEAMSKSSALASMLIAAKDGENPFVWLAENVGMDLRELANDPEFGKKMTSAVEAWQKKQNDGKAAQQEMEANFKKSVDALGELCNEKGIGQDEAQEIYTKFFETIVEPATRGDVTKETWELMRKGMKYDSDIEDATRKASAKALNEKIENRLRKQDGGNIPPSLSGSGDGKGGGRKKPGFFSGIS